jgi:hypothetical protein
MDNEETMKQQSSRMDKCFIDFDNSSGDENDIMKKVKQAEIRGESKLLRNS